ncbi:cupin domain-containing protein [Microbacterium sp. cf332]|uniref:cupin domain-containing protein n=1 Tax=Microbacterium sp. cf332 TaxID=1761804 RepID=UPI000887482C|nr:cupin domain-containing protein [Microbacterium sp. cf332]SDQ14048.1 Cupin domain-containing protein [Microbacterium sp. cf332]
MRMQRRGEDALDWRMYRGEGQVQVERYFRASTRLAASVMFYHLEPGAEEGVHHHLADDPASCSTDSADEMYVVTRGEVVVTGGPEPIVLREGDAAYAPHGVPHGVRNDSRAPAELVLVYGPPLG